jgi:hypothetical protein
MNILALREEWRSNKGKLDPQRVLEQFTPQGSEFHNEPMRCAEFIHEQITSGDLAKKESKFLKDLLVMHGVTREVINEYLDSKIASRNN